MIKNIIGFILGLLGMLFFYSAASGYSLYRYPLSPGHYIIPIILPAILPAIGILFIYLSVKLIDLKEFEKSPLSKVTFKINHIIIFLIVFLLVVMSLILLLVNPFI
jgi:hypothetical protein